MLVAIIFLELRFFHKSGFLESRVYYWESFFPIFKKILNKIFFFAQLKNLFIKIQNCLMVSLHFPIRNVIEGWIRRKDFYIILNVFQCNGQMIYSWIFRPISHFWTSRFMNQFPPALINWILLLSLLPTKEMEKHQIQVILFEINCAIFYSNLHELFCQFISWTNWQILVNLWTIAEYYVKLWLIS